MNLIPLYRPVGQKELDLIAASGFTAFPPRLPEQPFFYPVLHEEYAAQIARNWNTQDPASGYRGYVLRFYVRSAFYSVIRFARLALRFTKNTGFLLSIWKC